MNRLSINKAVILFVALTMVLWSVGLAAFAPTTAKAASLVGGDLITSSQTKAVYLYASNGTRYVFPNEKSYKTWYSDFSGVKTIDHSELQAVSLSGKNVVYRPGTYLLKITTDPKVYAVEPSGVLRWVETEAVASSLWGANWAKMVQDLPDEFFANYTIGTSLSTAKYPTGSLVSNGGKTYYINASGQKQEVTAEGMTANRFQSMFAVAAADLSGYTAGTTVSAFDSTLADTSQGGGVTPVTPTTGGTVSASLASNTPASTNVPVDDTNNTTAASNVGFTYVNLTAGATDAVISKVKVTRTGLGTDSNISSVKLFVDNVQIGNSQSLSSASTATFSNISITVPANSSKVLVLGADIAPAAISGNTLGLSIEAGADITVNSGTVSGTFPIRGNQMTLVNLAIGSATVYNGALHPASDQTVDPDAKDFRFTQVKVQAGGTEDLKVTQITAIRNGTAGDSDVKDIKLVNDKDGSTVSTVASLTNGRAVFNNLSVTVPKGENLELSVIATLVGGAGRTIAFDLHDGTAYTIRVVGQKYGFEIIPTRNNFCAANGTCQTQTINQGYLTVSKSSKTPATGNIPLGGTGITLAAFDFDARGEDINVTQTQFTITPGGTGSASDWTNIGLYDATGALVAGPRDGSTTTAATAQTLTFTDAFKIPVGVQTYYIKGNLSSSAVATETIAVTQPANSVTAKGANAGKTVYTTATGTTMAPSSAITSNTLTILGAALQVVTAGTPVASSVVTNAQDQVFSYFDLNATSGGEVVRVSSVTMTDTLGTGTDYSGLNNLELWGDPDNTDATETSVKLQTSNSTATNANTVLFTFVTPLKVSASSLSRLKLIADVVSATGTSHTLKASAATATGWTTGNDITETFSGTGQAQTVQSVGRLAITASGSRPSAAQYVANSTGNLMMSYRFASSFEDIDVTELYVATNRTTAGVDTTSGASGDVARVKLYKGGTQIGATNGYTLDSAGKAYVVLNNGTLVVPKDDYVTIDIKVDFTDRTQLTDNVTFELGLGDATGIGDQWDGATDLGGGGAAAAGSYLIVATGKSSGSILTATTIHSAGTGTGNVVASNTNRLHDGILTVTLNSSSPSGLKGASGAQEVLRFNLTATGDDITVTDFEFTPTNTCTITGTTATKLYLYENGSIQTGTSFATWAAGTTWMEGRTQFSVSGDDSDTAMDTSLQVSVGTTKTLSLVTDTTGCTTNNTLQITLQGTTDTVSGVDWQNRSGNVIDSALTRELPLSGGTITY